MRVLLGAHMSIAGGLVQALQRGQALGCSTIQLFTKNASQWKERVLPPEEIEAFRSAQRQTRIDPIISHGGYLVNLASPEPGLYARSIEATYQELVRCEQLGIRYLVLHPGAHRETGAKQGQRRVIEAIDGLYERLPDCPVEILLETTAGQGTYLGSTLEELRDLLGGLASAERVGLCLDTCHIFSAGYDLRTESQCKLYFERVGRLIGWDKLKVIHLNDSLKGLGSNQDRHTHIGQGQIGKTAFQWIMRNRKFRDIAKIIETPKVGDMDRINLERLRSYQAIEDSPGQPPARLQ